MGFLENNIDNLEEVKAKLFERITSCNDKMRDKTIVLLFIKEPDDQLPSVHVGIKSRDPFLRNDVGAFYFKDALEDEILKHFGEVFPGVEINWNNNGNVFWFK